MKRLLKGIRAKIKPRFAWWKGNYWDLGDAIVLVIVIICFFPILPWAGREKSNYSLMGKVAFMANVLSRFPPEEFDEALEIYDKKYKDKDLKQCKVSRDIVLSMLVRDLEMKQLLKRESESNVPAIFFVENLFLAPFLSAVEEPDFSGILLGVAENCKQHTDEFLDVEIVKRIYKGD